jgi:hypothetical protein
MVCLLPCEAGEVGPKGLEGALAASAGSAGISPASGGARLGHRRVGRPV